MPLGIEKVGAAQLVHGRRSSRVDASAGDAHTSAAWGLNIAFASSAKQVGSSCMGALASLAHTCCIARTANYKVNVSTKNQLPPLPQNKDGEPSISEHSLFERFQGVLSAEQVASLHIPRLWNRLFGAKWSCVRYRECARFSQRSSSHMLILSPG